MTKPFVRGASKTGAGGNTGDDKPLPDGLGPTEIGNAARLIRHAGHQLRYVHAWGKWLVYVNGCWILDEKDALVTELAKGVSAGLFTLSVSCVAAYGNKEGKRVFAWATRSCSASSIAATIKLARGIPGVIVNHERLDSDPWLLNVANGTVDLRTGALRPHNPDDLCTMQTPAIYDPKAVAPLWDKCLQKWQPGAEVLEYLQTRTGAGATGIPTETLHIDYGEGGNGKSKFHGAIQYVLGPYTCVPHKSLLIASRHEQHPTVVAKLFRKRLAVASETSAAEALDEEQVKNLTGGDRLEARRMRENEWPFWPTHTLVMFSNHKPAIHGRDEGIWRRVRLVPWQVTIAAKDRDDLLATKLQAEAAGILRWIVEGAVRFHREGLDPPAAVLAATAGYRQSEDVIGRFCDEALDFSPHLNCLSSDIKSALEDWCEEQGIQPPRMNDVVAIMRQRGAKDGGRKKVNGKRPTQWFGVCVS